MSPLVAALYKCRSCELGGKPTRMTRRKLALGTIPEDETEVAVFGQPARRRATGFKKKVVSASKAQDGAAQLQGPGEQYGSLLLAGLVANPVAAKVIVAQGALTDRGPLAAGLMFTADGKRNSDSTDTAYDSASGISSGGNSSASEVGWASLSPWSWAATREEALDRHSEEVAWFGIGLDSQWPHGMAGPSVEKSPLLLGLSKAPHCAARVNAPRWRQDYLHGRMPGDAASFT